MAADTGTKVCRRYNKGEPGLRRGFVIQAHRPPVHWYRRPFYMQRMPDKQKGGSSRTAFLLLFSDSAFI